MIFELTSDEVVDLMMAINFELQGIRETKADSRARKYVRSMEHLDAREATLRRLKNRLSVQACSDTVHAMAQGVRTGWGDNPPS